MDIKAQIRPFLNRPAIAYELCLIRSDGDRCYDRRLCVLSGTDAKDLLAACSGIEFIRASRNYVEDPSEGGCDGH